MKEWQTRLYDRYISTGQAGSVKTKGYYDNPYFEKLIQNHLTNNTNLSILDLACGHGHLIYSLKKLGYKNITGVDISAEQVSAAHKFGLYEIIRDDINIFLANSDEKAYDVVFLMDILEHLEKQEVLNLLDHVHRVLTDKGILIIHVPNGAGVFGSKVRYGDFTHQSAYTSKSIHQILYACCFQSIQVFEDKPTIHGIKSFIRYALWHILTIPFRLLLIAENGTTNHILSQNMLVKAEKSPG